MFRPDKARRILNFFERVLRHPRARGKPHFLLLKWQIEILTTVFGTVNDAGLRIIRRVYVEICKKNGKSELAAGIALYMLIADNEPGAEIYSAATTREQAAIVFKTAAAMVLASPMLSRKLKVIRSTKTIVRRDDPDSFYRAISADGGAQDGINPHCVIIDELHRWKTAAAFELLDVLTKGTVAREQPLVFEITTSGSTEDESPLCWAEHEYTLMMQDGSIQDPSFRGWIWAAGPDDDWTSPVTWAKANPSLETNGGFLKLEVIKSECDKAINQPRRQAAFKRYHLGQWLTTEAQWMDPMIWAENLGELRELAARPCYLGLDLSSVEDLTSLVLLFPDSDGTFDIKAFFWMAKEQVRKRQLADRVPYATWIKDGWIEACEGEVIDLKYIKKRIAWACERFETRELAFDPHSALQLSIDLTDELGLKCIPVPSRPTHLSEPMKFVMKTALQKQYRSENNPVLKWNIACVRSKQDDKELIWPVKPDRGKSGKRIDGAFATILAQSRGMFHVPSVYERRGLLTT